MEDVNTRIAEDNKQELPPSLSPLEKLKKNKTPLLVGGLVILTAALVILAVPVKEANHTGTSIKKEVPKASMSIGQPQLVSGKTYAAEVNVDSNIYNLTGTDLILKYDPKQIANLKVSNGELFSNPSVLYNLVDAKTGIASYSAVVGLANSAVKGKGSVAVITFTLIGSPSSSIDISFENGTHLAAQGQNSSVLGEPEGLEFSPQ